MSNILNNSILLAYDIDSMTQNAFTCWIKCRRYVKGKLLLSRKLDIPESDNIQFSVLTF